MTEEQAASAMQQYCSTHGIEIRNSLVQHYLYLARRVALKYSGRGIEYDDLYQIASLALINSLERFDCNRGIRFSTFALPTITGVVKNYFRDRSRLIRLPHRIAENARRLALAREELLQKLQRQPTVEELAQHMRLDIEDVLEAMDAAASVQLSSLDGKAGDQDETTLSDLLGAEEDGYERIALRDMLRRVTECMSETERSVLSMRYMQGLSQREIASRIGVSQMYVSRLEHRLLERFRTAMVQ